MKVWQVLVLGLGNRELAGVVVVQQMQLSVSWLAFSCLDAGYAQNGKVVLGSQLPLRQAAVFMSRAAGPQRAAPLPKPQQEKNCFALKLLLIVFVAMLALLKEGIAFWHMALPDTATCHFVVWGCKFSCATHRKY